MNSKIKGFIAVAILLIMPLAFFSCSDSDSDGGKKIDTDIDTDIDVLTNPGMKNPLTGVWKAGDEYWRFRSNGTGGKSDAKNGLFPDDFSFFVFLESQFYSLSAGAMMPKQSLVTLDDDGTVIRYLLSIVSEDHVTLTPPADGDPITLERVKGVPCALGLTNSLIGEYSATWSGSGAWSIAYYTDGTAKFYHLTAGHQFGNSYLLRGNTLVVCGNMRFAANPIKSTIEKQEDDTWKATEASGTTWYIYTKVDAATWKEE